MNCKFCEKEAYSAEYPFCKEHMLRGMGYETEDGSRPSPEDCPNCGHCPAFLQGEKKFKNIKQAGYNTCPVCGLSTWFVVNRCAVCEESEGSCPVFEDEVWAPGLALALSE